MKNYTIITMISFMVLAFTLPNAYGQSNSSSRVDKRIDEVNTAKAYRAELIKRIENSTCLTLGNGIPIKENIKNNPMWQDYVNNSTNYGLEQFLIGCVNDGFIK